MTDRSPRHRLEVAVAGEHVGTLEWRGTSSWFTFDEDYRSRSPRRVLSWPFEDRPGENLSDSGGLPPFFANLLPEPGTRLRAWIAQGAGVAETGEPAMLEHIGHDLPGAVTVEHSNGNLPSSEASDGAGTKSAFESHGIGFSLAGVGLKFSRRESADGFTAPAHGDRGDWICKLPDPRHPRLPEHELAMMRLADRVGIEIPEIRLVHRDEVQVPTAAWPGPEKFAYAIRRFDRGPGRDPVHAEDFAQVRGLRPESKYRGSFEGAARIAFAGADRNSLLEFVRRLTFLILIGNNDAHLKNRSLIYPDGLTPRLSPAYDIVATENYWPLEGKYQAGLTLGRERDPDRMRIEAFASLDDRLSAQAGLQDVARETIRATRTAVPESGDLFDGLEDHHRLVRDRVDRRSRSLVLRRGR